MSKTVTAFLISIGATAALGLIVLAAINANALDWLIAGVVVLSLLALGLSYFGVILTCKIMDARLAHIEAKNELLKSMASKGIIPTDGDWEPIRLQITAAPEPDGGELQDSEVEQYKPLAVQLVGMTYTKMGPQRAALAAAQLASNRQRWSPDRILVELRAEHSGELPRGAGRSRLNAAAIRYFGSRRKALIAAGLPPKQPPRLLCTWTPKQVIEAIHYRGASEDCPDVCVEE